MTADPKISILPCSLMIVNAALGAGMLNFPFAFSLVDDIFLVVILQFCTIILAFLGMMILAKGIDYGGLQLSSNDDDNEDENPITEDASVLSANNNIEATDNDDIDNEDDNLIGFNVNTNPNNPTSYESTLKLISGNFIGRLTEICITLYSFGTCITFTVVIGDLIESTTPCQYKIVSRISGTIIIMPVLLLLFFPRNISFLKSASIIGVLSVFVVCFVVVYRCFVDFEDGSSMSSINGNLISENYLFRHQLKDCPKNDYNSVFFKDFSIYKNYDESISPNYFGSNLITAMPKPINPTESDPKPENYFKNLLKAFPTMAFAYQCHISAVPIYATSLSNKSLIRWSKTITISFLLIFLINSTTGLCGYLKFKKDTKPNILSNFSAGDPFVIVARIFMGLAMVSSYPVLAFCGRLSLLNIFGFQEDGTQENSNNHNQNLLYNLITIIWVTLTTLIAIFLPNISTIIGVIGNLAVCFMLVFPGILLFDMRIFNDKRRNAIKNVASLLMISVGIVMFITCMVIYVEDVFF